MVGAARLAVADADTAIRGPSDAEAAAVDLPVPPAAAAAAGRDPGGADRTSGIPTLSISMAKMVYTSIY